MLRGQFAHDGGRDKGYSSDLGSERFLGLFLSKSATSSLALAHEPARELYKACPMAFDTAWIGLIDDAPIPKVHQSSQFGRTAHNARNCQSRATQSVSSPLPRVRQPGYSCYSMLIGCTRRTPGRD